jgi:drug/metabolite transporter (DMT)-like permease
MMALIEETVEKRERPRVRPLKVYSLLLPVILLKPFSNLFLAWGMRHFPDTLSTDPLPYLRAVADPLVAIGIFMQILWLLMRMALLSVADLSFVLPVTAVGYVLSTFLAHVFLGEQVSAVRWVGTGVIFCGTALVSLTARRSRTE